MPVRVVFTGASLLTFWAGLLVLTLALAIGPTGCAADDDAPGGGADTGAEDVGSERDTVAVPEVGGEDVSGSDTDTGAGSDTGSVDAAEVEEPDVTTPPPCGAAGQACCDAGGCNQGLSCGASATCEVDVVEPDRCEDVVPVCLEPPLGTPDVPVLMRSGAPPALLGGEVIDGVFELELIEIYADSSFSGLVSQADISSNGGTYGSLEFEGVEWGFNAFLDLYVYVNALGQEVEQIVAQSLTAGGCYSVVGNALRSDLTGCGANWPEGTTPPESLDYETTADGFRFLLILTREMILASIPEEDRFLAGLAITGDIPVLLTFGE